MQQAESHQQVAAGGNSWCTFWHAIAMAIAIALATRSSPLARSHWSNWAAPPYGAQLLWQQHQLASRPSNVAVALICCQLQSVVCMFWPAAIVVVIAHTHSYTHAFVCVWLPWNFILFASPFWARRMRQQTQNERALCGWS